MAGRSVWAEAEGLAGFAEDSTAAWCSQDPSRVAAHYTLDGSLAINGGAPAVGRDAIVSVEATEEAERRGLILALTASVEVTVVGDTGFEPVTSRM